MYLFQLLALLLAVTWANAQFYGGGGQLPPQFLFQQGGPYSAFGNGPQFRGIFPGQPFMMNIPLAPLSPHHPDFFVDPYLGGQGRFPPPPPFQGGFQGGQGGFGQGGQGGFGQGGQGGPGPFTRAIEQGVSSGFAGFPGPLSQGAGRGGPGGGPPFGGGPPPFGGQFGGLPPNQGPYFQPHLLNAAITDKDNFQPQGCGWDGIRQQCNDLIGICKGGCRDFSHDLITHDCRCVPFGYAALYNGSFGGGGAGKKKK